VKDTLLKILAYPLPLRLALARRIIRQLSLFSYQDRLFVGAVDRPHYGYCIFQAAKLASLLNYPRITVIEFGCGGGNGLLNAEMHITEVMKIFAVDIELYGFDMASGMPCPRDYRDMPHYFQRGVFDMDQRSLEGKLKRAKLVIGDVKDRCATFFDEYDPAPIACIFFDLVFYSSTSDALTLLDASSSHFLPRIFMYFDDIIGDDVWLCNEFTGERLAIEEFNRGHSSKKIAKNTNAPISYSHQLWWPHHVYVYHDFGHPKYSDFVAYKELKNHQDRIRLK
jgi:hypothetical protein